MNIPDTIRPETAALLVIDMQNAYFNAGELGEQKERIATACNQLLSAFRSAQQPVLFVRTAHRDDGSTWTLNMQDDKQGYLFDGGEDVDTIDELARESSDIIITKLRDSAFYATILEQILHQLHIDTLVIAGISTQTCVGQTAADAYARNIRVMLAEDAIATHDHAYHEPTLGMLEKEYRQTRATNDTIMKWLQGGVKS